MHSAKKERSRISLERNLLKTKEDNEIYNISNKTPTAEEVISGRSSDGMTICSKCTEYNHMAEWCTKRKKCIICETETHLTSDHEGFIARARKRELEKQSELDAKRSKSETGNPTKLVPTITQTEEAKTVNATTLPNDDVETPSTSTEEQPAGVNLSRIFGKVTGRKSTRKCSNGTKFDRPLYAEGQNGDKIIPVENSDLTMLSLDLDKLSLTNQDGRVRTLHKINPEILEHARRTCNADVAEIIEDAEYIIVEKTNTPTNTRGTLEDQYIKTEDNQDFSIGQEIEESSPHLITESVRSVPREPDTNNQ